jgi:hypothetical protein
MNTKKMQMLAIISLVLFSNCATKKRPTIETHRIDSTHQVVNMPISDKIFISIPEVRTVNKDCDSLAQDAVYRFASGLRGEKQSGANSYKYYWNGQDLVFDFKMGQTATKYRYKENKERVVVPEKYIPKHIQYLAWLGLIFILYVCFKIYRYAKINI